MTPETDALIAADSQHVSEEFIPDSAYWRMAEHSMTMERERDELRNTLAVLMPFVLEDYYPNCATPQYLEAVEAAKSKLEQL